MLCACTVYSRALARHRRFGFIGSSLTRPTKPAMLAPRFARLGSTVVRGECRNFLSVRKGWLYEKLTSSYSLFLYPIISSRLAHFSP